MSWSQEGRPRGQRKEEGLSGVLGVVLARTAAAVAHFGSGILGSAAQCGAAAGRRVEGGK